MYAVLDNVLKKYLKPKTIFRHGFNFAPVQRSTGRLYFVSDDLLEVKVKIPISWRNRNYVGTIFGGSMASATDPIYMIQLMNILGDKYVVWDKETTIKFKRPADQSIYANFLFTPEEIDQIKKDVNEQKQVDLIKKVTLTNLDRDKIFAEVSKTIYVANKSYFRKKEQSETIN